MSQVVSSAAIWKQGGGYYSSNINDLLHKPLLPNLQRLRDRRIMNLFTKKALLRRGSHILEIGCGQSQWLPFLARQFDCVITGIDIEPFACELALANLTGAGESGVILCRDAFDSVANRDLFGQFDLVYSMGVMEHFDDASNRLSVLANYLKPEGLILTMVLNLQGINWLLQRMASLERLNMHVIYNTATLNAIHRNAGLNVLSSGYVGFHDGFVTASDSKTPLHRRLLHTRLCWVSNMLSTLWSRLSPNRYTPESAWFSPHVYCVVQARKSQLQ